MTDSTKDPRELIAEGRKHDTRFRDRDLTGVDVAGTVWLRNNLRALLDGYAAALDENDRTRAAAEKATAGHEPEVKDKPAEVISWLADNLEFSRKENERLGGCLRSRMEHARLRDGADVRCRADVLRLTETARAASENWMEACRQRDEARAERDAAIAGAYKAGVRSGQEDLPRAILVERMRPVVEAAVAWRAGAALVDSTSLDSDLENAIDAYRASKETK